MSRQPAHLGASIEVSPKLATESTKLPGLFPKGIRVYLPDLGDMADVPLAKAARRMVDLGYVPVPHIAARRCNSVAALDSRLKALTEEAGVNDVLLIAGGVPKPAGAFSSSMDVLETGLLDKYGITDIGIAGHPEGTPDFPNEVAVEALRLKAAFGERTCARIRIVTQFGFDGDRFVRWARETEASGVDLPIHIGIAGPAKISTLLKYAVACGVGNSLTFLRKRAMSLTSLATNHSPEDVVAPIERYVRSTPNANIKQLHVYTFGGLEATAAWLASTSWLRERGSWPQTELV